MGGTVKEGLLIAALLASLAVLVTTHLAIGVRMIWRVRPRYRGVVALFVIPLAPLWAYEQRWRRLSFLWVGALLTYGFARALASL